MILNVTFSLILTFYIGEKLRVNLTRMELQRRYKRSSQETNTGHWEAGNLISNTGKSKQMNSVSHENCDKLTG